MKFSLQELVVLGEVLKSVPARTPNRSEVIFQFANAVLSDVGGTSDQNLVDVDINCGFPRFQMSPACLDAVRCFIPVISETVSRIDGSSICPTIALPTTITCCDRHIKILGRHATMKLFDTDQVRDLHSYHGKCMKCKTSFYHGYKESPIGERTFFNDANNKFVMFNSELAYSKPFLRYVDGMICIGATSFEATANVYNYATENTESPLNSDRLEAAWFIHRILNHVTHFSVWPRKSSSRELDVENLCKMVYPDIKEKVNAKWIDHICDEIGCKNRAIVIDGNEKLYRYICGTEKHRVMGNTGEVNRYEMCIRNPVKGNQFSKPSKYCKQHTGDKPAFTEEQMDLRPVTRLYAKSISACETSEEGCKKRKNITSYYSRTAGMFYMFRPCGIRISHSEMYTSESCSDVFVSLIDVFGKVPDPSQLSLIAYDRTCDAHPFLARLSLEGNEAAKYYEKLKFIVDGFHVKSHTEKKCDLTSPECVYHPDLPEFADYKGMNTEIAEQSFNILNRFKYMTRKMTYCRRLLFFKLLDDTVNSNIQTKILRRQVP